MPQMTKTDLFQRLRLLDDYNQYRSRGGYLLSASGRQPLPGPVGAVKHTLMPAINLYDHPAHLSVSDLQQGFMSQPGIDANERAKLAHSINKFNGLSASGHHRYYQLVACLEDDPAIPVAFVSFNIALQDFWYYEDKPCAEDKFGVCCHVLHLFVVPHLRKLGLGHCLMQQLANLFWGQLQYVGIQLAHTEFGICPIVFRGLDASGSEQLLDEVVQQINHYETTTTTNRELFQQSISNL